MNIIQSLLGFGKKMSRKYSSVLNKKMSGKYSSDFGGIENKIEEDEVKDREVD